MRKILGIAAICGLTGVALAACGSDSDDKAQAAAFELVQPTGGGEPELNGPATLKGGAIELTFKNTGEAPADLQLVGVQGDHSADEVLEVIGSEDGPIPDWLSAHGGLGTVAPGQSGTATVLLGSGKYYAVGQVDSEDDDGPAPATMAFDVSGGSKGSLPKADATITAKEYSFDVSGLKAGSNLVKFENTGQQLHHVIAAPLADGKSVEDAKAFFATEGEPTGEPPIDFESSVGTAVIDKGQALVTTLDLTPGKYVFVCFMTDRAGGGAPHMMQGMIREVDVAA